VVVTNAAGTTTYVEGTDYVIDYKDGYFINKSGAISNSDSILVDYAYGASSGWKVDGETVAQITGKFIFKGENIPQKRRFKLEIPYLVLTSDKEFDFLSDNLSEFTFKGTPILQDGETSSFYLTYYT
jgi:hypothetical protein